MTVALDEPLTFDPMDDYQSMVPRLRDDLFEYAERCDREALELEQRAWALQREATEVAEIARSLQ